MQSLAASRTSLAHPHAAPSQRRCAASGRPGRRALFARASSDQARSSDANPPPQQAPSNVCKTCGIDLSQAPRGCDGEGRLIGGLGAVPGFGWWPIKAYRPCPAANEAGVRYTRKGQITDEMLFGRGGDQQ